MLENAVKVEGLIKRFGEVTALNGISFEIPAATIFGLLGPNGAGKSTAIRILSTILRPDGGRAEVLGHDVAKHPAAVRHQIGMAGQAAAVDPILTGRENLQMIGVLAQLPRKVAKQRAAELLERFFLDDAADRRVAGYSGGMRRRLDVAAALVARPPVLFLDEPTTGLDIQSRTQLWEVIRELVAQGATVLLTTQYLEEADRLAQRIAVVDHGRVIADDTASGLKSRLGGTVVELGMHTEIDAAAVADAVGQFDPDHAVTEGALVRFSSRQAPKLLAGLLRVMDDRGLAPATLSVREPSLDDVFLALTGHHPAATDNRTAKQVGPAQMADEAVAAPDAASGRSAPARVPTSGAAHSTAVPQRKPAAAKAAKKPPANAGRSRKPSGSRNSSPSGKKRAVSPKPPVAKKAAAGKKAAKKSSARKTVAPERTVNVK